MRENVPMGTAPGLMGVEQFNAENMPRLFCDDKQQDSGALRFACRMLVAYLTASWLVAELRAGWPDGPGDPCLLGCAAGWGCL
jgi:hypothetical protein